MEQIINKPIGSVLYFRFKIRSGITNSVKQYLNLDEIPNFAVIIYRHLKNIGLIAKKKSMKHLELFYLKK
jgi:hypothetical protein